MSSTKRTHQERRYAGCVPATICGRKVWIAQRGGYGSSLKEIWVHTNPCDKAVIYLKGSSLTEGDAASNWEYLEFLCAEKLSTLPPNAASTIRRWNEEVAENAAYDAMMADRRV
jgi:hypothetical protein